VYSRLGEASRAIHGVLAAVARGHPIDSHEGELAIEAPLVTWRRVLGFEGCAVQIDRALRASTLGPALPGAVREILRTARESALRLGVLSQLQLREISALAHSEGIRVLVLKGAAQLLAGHGAARSLADIDLLVLPEDAARFHASLVTKLGYTSTGPVYPHHLPVLTRGGSLNIDLHTRLSDVPSALDASIWSRTRRISLGVHALRIPSATGMVLHVLEHGVRLNWMGRYRLRDILDLAALYTPDVTTNEVREHAAEGTDRAACETLLSAAHDIEPRVPTFHSHAWRTIQRVSRARLAVAALARDPRASERCFRYAGVVAEGSPRTMLRAGGMLLRNLAAAVMGGRRRAGQLHAPR
jgi:hypothetical protein